MAIRAEVATGTSIAGTAVSWLAHANEVVQLIAGIVAIISGCAGAYYYIRRHLRERHHHGHR